MARLARRMTHRLSFAGALIMTAAVMTTGLPAAEADEYDQSGMTDTPAASQPEVPVEEAGETVEEYVASLRSDPDILLEEDLVFIAPEDIIWLDDYQTAPVPANCKPGGPSVVINGRSYYCATTTNWTAGTAGALGGCIKDGLKSMTPQGCAVGAVTGGAAGVVVGTIYSPQGVLVPTPRQLTTDAGYKSCRGRYGTNYLAPINQVCR